MKKKIKKIIVSIIEFGAYKVISSKHRRQIVDKLPSVIKKRIKGLVKNGKQQKKFNKVERLKYKLRNLGFEEKALFELEQLMETTNNNLMKKLIAWELAVWHSNKQTEEGARQSIKLLPIVSNGEKDPAKLRQITIIEAENLMYLGHKERAKSILDKMLRVEHHPDLYLARANTEDSVTERLKWVNKVYNYFSLSEVYFTQTNDKRDPYDQLSSENAPLRKFNGSKVTVIIPVYNAEEVIKTSLLSILNQTWSNLEVMVVDDCSNDETENIIRKIQKKDNRVHLLKTPSNSGAYVARNIALSQATGDFVTINDADDWSHSKKIETQVMHLLKNEKYIGNTSQQARATENLSFFRRGKPGLYLFSNMSSFMFRRKEVMDAIGYWDSVRFGGDSEFIKRIKYVFGEESIIELETGPLSFQRQSETSLTGNSSFGFPGFFMGARKEYLEAQVYYHKNNKNLYYEFPMKNRPFPAPEPMLPQRIKDKSNRRHFDVIIVSDFRLDGGSTLSSVEEIKAQQKAGYKTGIIQMARYDYPPKKKINPKVRDLIDGETVQLLVYGEKVSCDVLILRYPPMLQEKQIYIPDVVAKDVRLIINQPPQSAYGTNFEIRYDLDEIYKNMIHYFGTSGTWHTIGPLIREALITHHPSEIANKPLSQDDWYNIIDIEEWNNFRKTKENKPDLIKIGRHSRDSYVKWPETKEEMLSVYPENSNCQILVLGGASIPKRVIGYLPENWKVYEFGEISSQQFLKELDLFIYFTHSDWVESFGRVIIEAMAAGVPVVLPNNYKPLFKDAANYAEPDEVESLIMRFRNDPSLMKSSSEKALRFVEENFSYSMHQKRIEKIISN
ncbi:glycosyltransferase [Gracilibacillus thailandensis]|uniref:Glycosyltransferase n=1 Tax=Gracilibacillus thailandensis TaxID=563735 RepID=A0A6N7R3Y1_9BACI|nr:glycosyltransferase [Gracilibacillus thailandensis]MRI67922.1 glycosyltransferase [Gracilibacillus thailandensis]